MKQLDVKDKKLLYEIDLNARLGTSALGKKIGLSQEGVHYRLQRLEKKRIISGYITLINFGKVGYTGYAIYSRFQNVTKEKKQEIIDELTKNTHVYWIAEFGGKFDLAFAIMARNIIEFNDIFTELSTQYSEFLKDLTIAIRAELIQFPRDYLIEQKERRKITPRFGKYIEAEKLEKIDVEILKEITQNPRLSVLEISNKLRNSPLTIKSHLKNLEKEIIQGYSTRIHCQEFGFESYQLFLSTHNLTKDKKSKLISYCQAHPNIIFYIETVGKWNFEIIYEIENQKELQELVIEIRTKFSDILTDVESAVLFNHYVKYNQYPFE
ncbi:Lrp/AsnC family transcriptional regulator [Candidatus Pacearchaeota archaeon]|nr:Lrp/AsnC family transcriptional regulator [Candidatus Pacearchaeota archaeon]